MENMIELYFIDHDKKRKYRFAYVDCIPALLEIAQILADTRTGGLRDVVALEPSSGNYYDVARIAAHYGLRKRALAESMDDVQTWTYTEA